MNETLMITPIQTPQAVSAQTANFVKHGNIFNGSVNSLTNNHTIFIDNSGVQQQIELSRTHYNLFVVKDERFIGVKGSFSIIKNRASQYQAFSESEKLKIMTFPSLFMDINNEYRKCTDAGQQFYYGIITEVHEQGKSYKIYFQKMTVQPLFQQQLNNNSIRLGINKNNGHDVLGESVWKIIKLDLRKALFDVGIYYA